MALESIALVPSGYKATKVYSQLPVDGGGDFTFDRGTSTAQTRVNKDGLIESVAQDVPRLDYLDGGCPSLLLEPASTNSIPNYNTFTPNANVVLVTDSALSPNGSVNAVKVTGNSGTSLKLVDTIGAVAGTYVFSVFAKKGTHNLIQLGGGGIVGHANFDLDSGTAGSGGVIQAYPNGWYRCSVQFSTGIPTSHFIALVDSLSSARLSTSTATGDVYLFGMQSEQTSYPTSLIPTSGTLGVRAAETCNGAGTTAEINSQEGVLYAEIRALANDGTGRIISLGEAASSNNRVQIFYQSASNTIYANYRVGGSTLFTISSIISDVTNYSKVAFKYKSGEFKLLINGLNVGVNTNTTLIDSGTLDTLAFNQGGGFANFYGRVKRLSVYDSALTDSQLESLTGFGSFSEMAQYLNYA